MAQPIPPFMEKGSKGPHTLIPQLVACGAGYGKDIVFDGNYGDVTAGAMSQLQARNGIDTDGSCGPETRRTMKHRYNVDFEKACRLIPGTTIFIQPDGSEIPWSPDND